MFFGYANINGIFNIILQTLQKLYMSKFSERSKTLDEHPTKTFQKKNIPWMMYMC